MIGRALAGNPPEDIADELRDLLLEEVYSHRQPIGRPKTIRTHRPH
ncbi:MAG: hypothetical protein SFW36_17415 [Leptolyngbyaceae cyanobacterium bins.59]|nr:hypothetical protein [Leptolyngbyaceae cyanobacterium bins.59]